MERQIGTTSEGEPLFGIPPNRVPRKRVRNKKKKMARNAYQRENVLTDRDCLRPGWERKATETERAEELAMTPKRQEKRFKNPSKKKENRTYEGNFKLNTGVSEGVVTHPVPEFTKSRSYPHQRLEEPSHLWCDVVHATDADVRKGNQTRSID